MFLPQNETNTITVITKAHKETFGGIEYVYYIDHRGGFMGVCIFLNSSNYVL